VTTSTISPPGISIRGRSIMALIVSPELPLPEWLEGLDEQMRRAANFFADRPVIVHFPATLEESDNAAALLDALDDRELRIVGVEGIETALLNGTRWARLPKLRQGRPLNPDTRTDRLIEIPDDPVTPTAPTIEPAAPALPAGSLVIDRPVRSGQSIFFEEGDITVIGSVASGAEVIAGGSVHIYGTLRGRAVAGIRTGAGAHIFCRKLAAELISIDGLYDTPEHWGDGLHGRAVHIRLEHGALKLSAFD
jgi:septum site-determining protein MinC